MAEDQTSRVTRRSDIVSRRLAQLSAELSGTRPHEPLPEPLDPPTPDGPQLSLGPAAHPGPARGSTGSSRSPTSSSGFDPEELDELEDFDEPGGGSRGRVLPVPGRHAASVRLGAPQLAVVSVVVALGVLLTAWWTVRSRSEGELVPSAAASSAGASPAGLATPAGSTAAPASPDRASGASSGAGGQSAAGSSTGGGTVAGAAATAAGTVVVDVAGKVRRPGIVVLPTGSRVVDALREAGGARPRVDLLGLNQARVLVDGEQIVVGQALPAGVAASAVSQPGVSGGSAGVGALVDLNSADQATLEELPGVGPVTAQAILAWRTEHGAFSNVDELLEVDGIGDKTLADIAPHVTL